VDKGVKKEGKCCNKPLLCLFLLRRTLGLPLLWFGPEAMEDEFCLWMLVRFSMKWTISGDSRC
jgi:hypothetical protein